MNNKFLIGTLSVIGVIILGSWFIFAIGNAVSGTLAPVNTQLGEIKVHVMNLERKLSERGGSEGAVANINQKIGAIDAKLSMFMGGARNGQQPPQRPPMPQEDSNAVYTIEDGQSPILGNKNAPITIVEFSDLQCPFCNRFHPVVKDVIKAYPDKVRGIIKNFPLPFHSNALPAAKLALAANLQGKYFEMVDLLLQNQASVADDKVKEYAKQLGLNYNKLMDDYKNKDAQFQKMIDDDKALAEKVAVQGTPTFYLNGKKTNARDLESYKAEIDKILAGKK